MSIQGASPTMIIMDEFYNNRCIAELRRAIEKIDLAEAELKITFMHEIVDERNKKQISLLDLYGLIEFPEELKAVEEKSNKPYWRKKERW